MSTGFCKWTFTERHDCTHLPWLRDIKQKREEEDFYCRWQNQKHWQTMRSLQKEDLQLILLNEIKKRNWQIKKEHSCEWEVPERSAFFSESQSWKINVLARKQRWFLILMSQHSISWWKLLSSAERKNCGEQEIIITFSNTCWAKTTKSIRDPDEAWLPLTPDRKSARVTRTEDADQQTSGGETRKETQMMAVIDDLACWYEILFLVSFNYSPWIKAVCISALREEDDGFINGALLTCSRRRSDTSGEMCGLSSASQHSISRTKGSNEYLMAVKHICQQVLFWLLCSSHIWNVTKQMYDDLSPDQSLSQRREGQSRDESRQKWTEPKRQTDI